MEADNEVFVVVVADYNSVEDPELGRVHRSVGQVAGTGQAFHR